MQLLCSSLQSVLSRLDGLVYNTALFPFCDTQSVNVTVIDNVNVTVI